MRTLNLCTAFLLSVATCLQAQVTVVKEGKPVSRILIEKDNSVDNQAALLLQDFVQRISGASLPVLTDKSPRYSGTGPCGESCLPLPPKPVLCLAGRPCL